MPKSEDARALTTQLRELTHVLVVGLLALSAGCAAAPAPTEEEAAPLLDELEPDERLVAMLKVLAAAEAAEAKVDASRPPDAPAASSAPPAPAIPSATAQRDSAGTPRMLPKIKISEMKCDRVDRKTHDCQITWKRQTGAPISGRYRFVRGPEKWTVARAPK